MTDGGENCHGLINSQSPAVLWLEKTSAQIQVLLRVKGEPKLPSSSVHE